MAANPQNQAKQQEQPPQDQPVVRLSRHGAIGVVCIDNPQVNALSHGVRAGLQQAARDIAADDTLKAAVLLCTGCTFSAGADIAEFGQPARAPSLPELISAIETSAKPWIAAIHGTALGGGLELALGCHARIAVASAKLGLPEVTLGLIPGAGGTQRLPRLIGVAAALAMITTGRPVSAAAALDSGLIDHVVVGDLKGGDLAQAAIQYAGKLATNPPRRTFSLAPPSPPDENFWTTQKAATAKKARGQIAPVAALEAVQASCTASFTAGLKLERDLFSKLRGGEQSAALRHVFFAERAVSKLPQLQGAPPRDITSVGIIGGGTMGTGIAAACLDAGLNVSLIELTDTAAENSAVRLRSGYDRAVQRGRLTRADHDARLSRFTTATSHDDLASADLIIEAVIEDEGAKQAIFRALSDIVKPDAICASNTSYLDINALADTFAHRQNFVGLHFFAPANIMKLVEIVAATQTAPDVLASCFAFTKKLRKTGVLAGACSGFIGNRILQAYRNQGDILLLEGALPEQIDDAMRGFGMAMGLYEVQDLSGLDIGWAQRKAGAATRDANARYIAIADKLCERGRFGQKTGAGWYRYEPGSRRPIVDPLVSAIIAEEAQNHGIRRRQVTAQEITSRLPLAMINEAAKLLDENIAQRPLDIDVVTVNGYGLPRWRGGLMWHGDQIGIQEIKKQIDVLAREDAAAWRCAPLIERLAAQNKSFTTLNELPQSRKQD